MDQPTVIVIFLAFTSVTVVTNTLLFLFAYKAFAALTSKATEAVREVEASSATREWIASMERAAVQAVSVTAMAKQKMEECDPVLDNMQGRYQFMLAKLDTKVERITDGITETATKVRDVVAGPAGKIEIVTGLLRRAVSAISPDATSRP